MGAEYDINEVVELLNGLYEVGPRALAYLVIDFWTESTENANIDKGTLRDSIQMEPVDDYTWIVGTNLEYAPYVHEGFPAHEILPKNKEALFWPGARHPVKRVWHPGYKGNPFFETAKDTVEDRMEEYITMATEDLT